MGKSLKQQCYTSRAGHHPPHHESPARASASVWLKHLLFMTIIIILSHTSTTHSLMNDHVSCPKSWIALGQKCYRFMHNPRHLEGGSSRCGDLTSRLATIDDDSNREKENGPTSSIFSYLSQESKKELQSKLYYVNLSQELLNQYPEWQHQGDLSHMLDDPVEHESSSALSLWHPRDDPSLIDSILLDPSRNSSAFCLAYSKHYKRWGIIPISPTRKINFICERLVVTQLAPPRQATPNPGSIDLNQDLSGQNPEHRRTGDLARPNPPTSSSTSATVTSGPGLSGDQTIDHQSKPQTTYNVADSSTTSQPETASMLFREFPTDRAVVLGSTIEMRCSPLDADSTLIWTFNGKNLTSTNRIKVLPSGILRIEQARNTDDGSYNCTVTSGSMSESKLARLDVIERPHQPEYVQSELLDPLSTSVRVQWTPGFNGNSPIKKYSVEMRTVENENFGDPNIETGSTSANQPSLWEVAKGNITADQTSVIIPDLKPARKYIFRVKATNQVGESDPSLPTRQTIEVPVQPPSMAPENLSGTPKSSTSILVQWSPPPADSQNGILKSYKIRHKLAGYATNSEWYTSNVADAAHLTYLLSDLIVWQNYEIQVAAENDKGVGPFSASIFVRTKEGRPDKGPTSVAGQAISSSSVKVTWNPPPPRNINGASQGYRVQAWLDNQMTKLAKEMTVPYNQVSRLHSAILEGLEAYTQYQITVKCFTNAGDGPPNDEQVLVRTSQDRPEAVPSLEFADVLDKSLRVIWRSPDKVNGILDHYSLEYSESSSFDRKQVKTFPHTTTETRISDLTPQTAYVFRITAYTMAGAGPERTNRVTTNVPPTLPESPSNLVVSNISARSVLLHFRPGSDGNAHIEKWLVDAYTPPPPQTPLNQGQSTRTERWNQVYVSTNHTSRNSLLVRNLRPFTRYRLRLTPLNVVGPSLVPSDPTAEFQTAQVEPEQPPRDLTVDEVKSSSALASWSPLSNSLWMGNPRGYNLTWTETNNGTSNGFVVINETRAHSCQVEGLEEFTEYSFKIYAINEVGLSPASESIVITTLEDVPSSGPSNLTAHALTSTSISVDWNSIPKRHRNGVIRGYRIQYQANKQDAPILNKTLHDNTTRHATLTELSPFTVYRIAVAGFTIIGEGVHNTVLDVQTLEDTPGKVQNLTFPAVSQTSVRLEWEPPMEPNGQIIGYKLTYEPLSNNSHKEAISSDLHQNNRTFRASNLKPNSWYQFTVTAKTKEGWGQQRADLIYTQDAQLRPNLPFHKELWFSILCISIMIMITLIVTLSLYIQTRSERYQQDNIKSTSQDHLGDAGFSIDDDIPGGPNAGTGHYSNNGFSLLSHHVGGSGTYSSHRRSAATPSQSTANLTLLKPPPRPHPGSVAYSEDDGDDDVFENVEKQRPGHSRASTSAKSANYGQHRQRRDADSSGDSLTEKPSEISSSTTAGPESESPDEEYVNMAAGTSDNRSFRNHYANVHGTLRSNYRGGASWRKPSTSCGHKQVQTYGSHRTKPKLPQRPVPQVPQVPQLPNGPASIPISSNDPNCLQHTAGTSSQSVGSSIYSGQSASQLNSQEQELGTPKPNVRNASMMPNNQYVQMNGTHRELISTQTGQGVDQTDFEPRSGISSQQASNQPDILNSHIMNLNGGRIIVDNMAGSRAPLPGFTSFV